MASSVLKFDKSIYPKIALLKAAYNFTDRAFVHLDSDEKFYYVNCEAKNVEDTVCEKEFLNELLAQSVRHEVYLQTKDIRELLMARAMATSVVYTDEDKKIVIDDDEDKEYQVEDIIRDWFESDDNTESE